VCPPPAVRGVVWCAASSSGAPLLDLAARSRGVTGARLVTRDDGEPWVVCVVEARSVAEAAQRADGFVPAGASYRPRSESWTFAVGSLGATMRWRPRCCAQFEGDDRKRLVAVRLAAAAPSARADSRFAREAQPRGSESARGGIVYSVFFSSVAASSIACVARSANATTDGPAMLARSGLNQRPGFVARPKLLGGRSVEPR
jgi:hypothetical protein